MFARYGLVVWPAARLARGLVVAGTSLLFWFCREVGDPAWRLTAGRDDTSWAVNRRIVKSGVGTTFA